MWQRVRAAPPWTILGLGWLVVLVYAYPGQMTEESFAYLRQARSRFFSDAYAPAVSSLWRIVEVVVGGPTGMLVLQLAACSLGAYAILRRSLAPRAAAWTTTALLVFPPVLVSLAVISDHAIAAGALALGAGALLHDRRRAGFAALLVATAVRPSAVVATLPLALLAWRDPRRYVAAVVAWLAITAAALGADVLLAKGPLHPHVSGAGAARVLWLDGLHREAAVIPRELPDSALKVGVPTRSSELQDAATSALGALSPLFAPWLYVALALALVVAWLARGRRESLALVASGLAYEAALLVTASGPAPGQSLWLVASLVVAWRSRS